MHCCLGFTLNQHIKRARNAPLKSWANDFFHFSLQRKRMVVPRDDAASASGKKSAQKGSGVPRLSTPLTSCGSSDSHQHLPKRTTPSS